MQSSAVLGFLFVICLPITAEPVGSFPEENKAQYPAVAANFKPVREEAILQLADFVKHGDTLLKERLQASYNDLREELKQGDAFLNGQQKDGDSRLKQELDEDVAWLKLRLNKVQDRLNADLAEEEKRFTSEMSDLKEAFAKLQDSVKTNPSSAVTDDLKQQMDDVQAELGRTRDLLQTTQTELDNTKQKTETLETELDNTKRFLETEQTDLNNTKELLGSTKQKMETLEMELDNTKELLGSTKQKMETLETELGNTKELLGSTKQKMETLETELGSTKELLGSTKELLDSTKQKAETTEQELHRTRQELQTAQAEVGSLKAEVDGLQSQADTGSTFTRWGSRVCPDNTSLVYSGLAGGSLWSHTGGASNYLCLVRDPQLDKTDFSGSVNNLYGAEYEEIQGHHDRDVVCAVCRAPHPTSIMIPATVTCPDGWTSQYKGHLMSGYYSHKGRTEYVCVDDAKEFDDGGQANNDGALFYRVKTQCGSLPCPPYAGGLLTTCVVCSQ